MRSVSNLKAHPTNAMMHCRWAFLTRFYHFPSQLISKLRMKLRLPLPNFFNNSVSYFPRWRQNSGLLLYITDLVIKHRKYTDINAFISYAVRLAWLRYTCIQFSYIIIALGGFPVQRMNEEQVLSELVQLFMLNFYEKKPYFHNSIVELWIRSGMDTDFFFTKALQWLLDVARIHGLPRCFHQCLAHLLMMKELSTEDDLREAIKLTRLFNHCSNQTRFGNQREKDMDFPFDMYVYVQNHFD